MTLEKLKSKLETAVAWLTAARERIRENIGAKTNKQQALQQLLKERDRLDGKISELETASPVFLQRKGLSTPQAIKAADELREKRDGVSEKISSLQRQLDELNIAIHTDERSADELLHKFNVDLAAYEAGELARILSTWLDVNSYDILYHLQKGSLRDLYSSLAVSRILDDRRRRIDRIKTSSDTTSELLAVLDLILAQPIPNLSQFEPAKFAVDGLGHLARG